MIQYTMPHVSRVKLEGRIEREVLNTLNLVLTKLSKEEDIEKFILALMTHTERLMLAKRLAIIILLREGMTESQIANAINVTRVTVSRMQLFLEARGEGYNLALKVVKNEELLNEIKSNLIKVASYAARAAGGRI